MKLLFVLLFRIVTANRKIKFSLFSIPPTRMQFWLVSIVIKHWN